MGQNTGDIVVKTFVTDANFAILGLADVFGPHGTAVRVLAEAMQRGLGGLWVGGHASVQNGTLQFNGNQSDRLVYGRDFGFTIGLRDTQVTVEKTVSGGLLPSSRLIIIESHGSEVRIVTPNGHGDALGTAINSWII